MVNRSGRERNNPPPPPRRRQPRQAAQQAQQEPQDPQGPPVVPPGVPPPQPPVQPPPVVANAQPPPVVPPPVVLNPQQVIMDRLLQAAGFNDRARAVLVSPQQEALTIDLLQTWKDHTVENTARTLRKTQVNVAPQGQAPQMELLYISASSIENLMTAAYMLRHMVRTQRVPSVEPLTGPANPQLTPAQIAQRFSMWTEQRLMEDAYEEPTEKFVLAKNDISTIHTFIDEFPEYLKTRCN
jgi:hypothetical protein